MHNPPDQGTRVFISPPRMPRIVVVAGLLINKIYRFVAGLARAEGGRRCICQLEKSVGDVADGWDTCEPHVLCSSYLAIAKMRKPSLASK